MDTKVCRRCREEKPITEFGWKNRAKGERLPRCRRCYKAWRAERNWDNTEASYESKRRSRLRNNARNLATVRAYQANHPCKECGESDPDVLVFHHRDAADKEFLVSRLSSCGYSTKRLSDEVAKCDVLCANCHHRLHARERNGAVQAVDRHERR